MTGPFCRQCAAELLGPEAVGAVKRTVADAPPLSVEQLVRLREVFRSVPPAQATARPTLGCGH